LKEKKNNEKEILTIEDRILIEELLRQNYKLKDIARAIEVYPSTLTREIKFRRKGNDRLEICNKTNRYPFICYNCVKKVSCKKRKYYYNYKETQKDYDNKLKYSRIGIDMSIDEVEYWNEYFKVKSRIKINQFYTYLKISRMNFLNLYSLFIIMFIKDIFQVLMMKCSPNLLVINPEPKKKKSKLLLKIILLKRDVECQISKNMSKITHRQI